MTTRLPPGPAPRPLICRDSPSPEWDGAVAAIGNFDGLHLGHQRLIAAALEAAKPEGRPVAVMTFEPHPADFFRPDDPKFRLTPEPVKLKLLGRMGVDIVFARTFDATLATTSAGDFVRRILAAESRLSEVVVGEDFHFGRGREGTPSMLAELARETGIRVRLEPPVMHGGAPISSSRVRTALAAGDVAAANDLLGYRWLVSGAVIHGEKRGRTLGFPTANMTLGPGCRLAHGIYAVRAALGAGEIRTGVASYGRRPTFDDGAPLLETFLFDFAGDLYGRVIEVELLAWIRGEQRFDTAEALVDRMRVDADEAREVAARPIGARSFLG